MLHSRKVRAACVAVLAALVPATAFAHGADPGAPRPASLLDWELDPLFIIPAALAIWAYTAGVRRVNRLHPAAPVPRRRVVFFAVGMATLVLAIMSPLAAYDGALFSAHMWQHVLLTMIATPLLLLGAPITLALRAASPSFRRRVLLPVLHSRVLKVLAFPVFAWLFFTVSMWGSHFTPLFNAALENDWLHRLEHAWYLSAAFLFWWPIVAADPGPWRMNHPMRMLYLFLQMPQNAFLALSIYNSGTVRYAHYASLTRTWGPSALTDQELAGITMWVGGDLLFLIALGILAYGWVQQDEREAQRQDRARAREKAAAAAARTRTAAEP